MAKKPKGPPDYVAAAKRGIELSSGAKLAQAEIRDVVGECSDALKKELGVTISIASDGEGQALVVRTGALTMPLAEVESAPMGYPVLLMPIGTSEEIEAKDRHDLQEALGEILSSPNTGVMIETVLAGKALAIDKAIGDEEDEEDDEEDEDEDEEDDEDDEDALD